MLKPTMFDAPKCHDMPMTAYENHLRSIWVCHVCFATREMTHEQKQRRLIETTKGPPRRAINE